jgi:beta-glucosidase/6-phospho-beta-glucosidase/beta-galactosidase
MTDTPGSFFLGGFECSTHRLPSGRRLDVVHATRHDELAASDYRLLQQHGIRAARDGIRWHLIERTPGQYDFSSAIPMLEAARETSMEVIWDLWHYGWPDDLDLFSSAFVDRFVRFAREAVLHMSELDDRPPRICLINEISFFSWAAGEGGIFNPFQKHRGDEVKRQLVRATIEAVDAVRRVNPRVVIYQIDPIINVVARSDTPEDVALAEAYRQSQFAAWDMVLGRREPELGGYEGCIDIVGVNYYIHNQFIWEGGMIVPSDPRYRHVSSMLEEIWTRYRRPVLVAETGIEGDTRAAWLRYMCREVFAAMKAGVPIQGVCLYPILNHPGWDDDRHCHNGMFDYADETGHREVFPPLADEVERLDAMARAMREGRAGAFDSGELETSALDWAAHVMQIYTDKSRS